MATQGEQGSPPRDRKGPFKGRNGSVSITAKDEKSNELAIVKDQKRFKSAKRGSIKEVKSENMSPKVIESWINDTLLEAQNLSIPGVILKPE